MLHGQEQCIVQIDIVHPLSPARAPEMLRSTRVSSVELLLPSFQLAPRHGKGSGPPRGVFQSFSHCFDSRDAGAGMIAPGEQVLYRYQGRSYSRTGTGSLRAWRLPHGAERPLTGRDLDQHNHVCVCFGAEDFGE